MPQFERFPPDYSVGVVPYYVLFVISIADRAVHVAGITTRPDETWMLHIGRSLLDEGDGALAGKRYLIIDRDTKYSSRWQFSMRAMVGSRHANLGQN